MAQNPAYLERFQSSFQPLKEHLLQPSALPLQPQQQELQPQQQELQLQPLALAQAQARVLVERLLAKGDCLRGDTASKLSAGNTHMLAVNEHVNRDVDFTLYLADVGDQHMTTDLTRGPC